MIGIDLGNKFLKVCKILGYSQKNKEYSIVSAMVDISALDQSAKTLTIASLLKKMDLEEESVYFGVSGTDIINRDIVLRKNKVNSKTMKNDVKVEVENTITEDLQKMYTAYSVVRDVSDTECNVIFSATPREKVNSKISLFGNMEGINVSGVTLESLALANAFNTFGPSYKDSESIILINIGHKITNVIVLNNKDLMFVKDIDFGGYDITKDISSFYMIPEQLSEEIKRREDLRQQISFNTKNILKKTLSSLVETIFRTIEHCITRQFIVAVDRIVVTGGGALTEGIDSFIEETLGIPTTKWNPLVDNKVVGYSNKDFGFFLPISLGLALEKENTNV